MARNRVSDKVLGRSDSATKRKWRREAHKSRMWVAVRSRRGFLVVGCGQGKQRTLKYASATIQTHSAINTDTTRPGKVLIVGRQSYSGICNMYNQPL